MKQSALGDAVRFISLENQTGVGANRQTPAPSASPSGAQHAQFPE